MWGQEDQWHPAQPRENHLGDCFFQQFCPMAEKNGNKIFFCSRGYELVFEKIFCKDWNFQVWRNTWDAKTLWERWAHRLEIHLLHSYLLSDTRAVRCDLCQMWCGRIGKHCQMWDQHYARITVGADFDSDPKPLSIPVSLPFKIHHHISGLDVLWLSIR